MDEKKVLDLESKISKFRKLDEKVEDNSSAKDHSMAMRIVSDLLAAIFVGFMLGYGLDMLLGTKPVFMLIFLFVGIAAGFLNVYRSATKEGD